MSTFNILIAGFGGQGVLFAGKCLAYKGLTENINGLSREQFSIRIDIDEENRTLAQAPHPSSASLQSGTFFSDLSTYLQDQIAGRDVWMRLKTTEVRMAGMRESGDVYLGKNGYLLEKPTIPDQTKIDRSIEQLRAFAGTYPDLNMVMTLVPCAAAVFPELLPDRPFDVLAHRLDLGLCK